jgi:hypothetical protein
LLFLAVSLDRNAVLDLLDLASRLVLILAVLGVIGFLLDSFVNLPILDVVNIGSRFYEFKGLIFTIQGKDSIVHIFGKDIFRLQGWFDEPGSFAFYLIPAIFYYLYKAKWIQVSILGIALLFSFSLGGILSVLIVIFINRLFTKPSILLIFIICLVISFSLFVVFFPTQFKWIIDYVQLKFGIGDYSGSFSSFGVRQYEYKRIFATLINFPLGSDTNSMFEFNKAYFSSGIVLEFTKYGIVGFFLRLCFDLSIVIACIVSITKEERSITLAASIALVLLLMGYQRMTFLRTNYFTILMIATLAIMKKDMKNAEM